MINRNSQLGLSVFSFLVWLGLFFIKVEFLGFMEADFLGYIAATLTTISFFPQALKTLRSRDTHSISLRMYLLFTTGVAFWALYGWMMDLY